MYAPEKTANLLKVASAFSDHPQGEFVLALAAQLESADDALRKVDGASFLPNPEVLLLKAENARIQGLLYADAQKNLYLSDVLREWLSRNWVGRVFGVPKLVANIRWYTAYTGKPL